MLKRTLSLSAALWIQAVNVWGQNTGDIETIKSDPEFSFYTFRVEMPLGQTFINKNSNCKNESRVKFHVPEGEAQPVFIKDTIGRMLNNTVSIVSNKTQTYSSSVTQKTRGEIVNYQVSGTMTMDDDPSKYLLEINPDPKVPVVLNMNLGYGSTWMDLTGLNIMGINIVSASADVFLSYKNFNDEPLKKLKINGGMGKIVLRNLEYSKAEHVDIENGMGDTKIIIGNEIRSNSMVTVDVGTGTCTMLVHQDAPMRIILNSNLFSSFDIPDSFMKSGDNIYTNLAYKKNPSNAIDVVVELGIGKFMLVNYE